MKEEYITKKESGWKKINEEEKDNIFNFSEEYISFLNKSKTERESCDYIVNELNESGFRNIDDVDKLSSGDKVYMINRNKSVYACVIGADDVTNGINFIGSHIDSPRLDLKPNPIYEDAKLALFKTHYYGGIKKYQWTAIPLAMHGVVVKTNGKKIDICIGENDNDPVFTISDLLPHLATEQMQRVSTKLIKGDELNILFGSIPCDDTEVKTKIKYQIMKLLNEKYDIIEQDLISADLSFVPAFKAKDLGLDSSMIGSYGHDDRVCAYTALEAHLSSSVPNKTVVTVFTDKEEIGSDGNTGLKSKFFEYFIKDLADIFNVNVRRVFSNSLCLSADVTSAFDPTWKEQYEIHNSAFLNFGVALTKYNGHRGKYDTSDASPKFLAKVINILDNNNVIWQTGGLGKVDIGGGGTIANYVANLDVEVLDIGVPVLSMHSPFEVVSKLDVYMTYKAFYHFINR